MTQIQTWESPNGVTHAYEPGRPCFTCGRGTPGGVHETGDQAHGHRPSTEHAILCLACRATTGTCLYCRRAIFLGTYDGQPVWRLERVEYPRSWLCDSRQMSGWHEQVDTYVSTREGV